LSGESRHIIGPHITKQSLGTRLIQGAGHEVGKSLPRVGSDFGLLDAIESGLVQVPRPDGYPAHPATCWRRIIDAVRRVACNPLKVHNWGDPSVSGVAFA